MTISGWLDKKEAEGIDGSRIALPDDLAFDENPDETLFFKEIKPCGFLCQNNHPALQHLQSRYFAVSLSNSTALKGKGRIKRQVL
jgi:hypothetical protein